VNILHLVQDEKFILFFDAVFSRLPDVENRYIVHAVRHVPLKHVEKLDAWRVVGNRYFFSREMTSDLAWADCLIVHYLTVAGARMLLKAPSHIARVWSGWGADYYGFMPGGERALLGEETARLMLESSNSGRVRAGQFLDLARQVKDGILGRLYLFPALQRVDYFSAPISNDFAFLQQALGSRFGAEYVQLNYGSVEQTFCVGEGNCVGGDILVGNSATPTNNHLEAFRLLARHDLSGRKIIVPLSYGLPGYREAVIKSGQAMFGDQFVPVREFLPLLEYARLTANCSVVVMNHRRQQALGNIGATLYRGAKVFLEECSPAYAFLKSRGAHVYATASLASIDNQLFATLDEAAIMDNRAVLEEVWGHDKVMKNAETFLSRMRIHRHQYA
jgi:dTDP-N-acetylfucosamine:lipid II N-acetylfucosaminyltransferase